MAWSETTSAQVEVDATETGYNLEQKSLAALGEKQEKLTWRHIFMAAIFCLAYATDIMCFSLLAPFFPKEAAKKGVSKTVIGIVFGTCPITAFFLCPVLGAYTTQIGARFLFISGIGICGVCTMLFGLLYWCPPGTVYIVMCLTVRATVGISSSMYQTAIYSMTGSEFPGSHVSTMVGLLETSFGLGATLGPVLGGTLYEIGGFVTPFFVLGVMTLVIGVTGLIVTPKPKSSVMAGRPRSFMRLIIQPRTILLFYSTTSGAMMDTFLQPVLQFFLSTIGIASPLATGGIFFIYGATYATLAVSCGWVVGKTRWTLSLITIGNAVCVAGCLLMGPASIFNVPPSLGVLMAGLVVQATGVSGILVPSYRGFVESGMSIGYPDDAQTSGYASGLFMAAINIGCFLGPVMSASLAETMSFQTITMTVALLPAACCILLQLYRMIRWCKGYIKTSKDGILVVVDSSPLLDAERTW